VAAKPKRAAFEYVPEKCNRDASMYRRSVIEMQAFSNFEKYYIFVTELIHVQLLCQCGGVESIDSSTFVGVFR